MSEPVRLTLDEAERLAFDALRANGTLEVAARATARALAAAEADGQAGHGLSRVPSYALQARSGKVNGAAMPRAARVAPGALRIDAGLGFAYPAIDLAIAELVPLARAQAIAVAAIHHSHHFGQVGAHAERLAQQGLVALIFGNTPKAMAFWGGRKAMLGTNPLAFASPWFTPDGAAAAAPLVVDLALSVAARGKIVAAQKAGRAIPSDWAVDAAGQPTTDPGAALAGTLAPIGGAKGGALALMVEILGAALTAGAFGWEASSFFDAEGKPPDMGHLFIAIDPGPLSGGGFGARMTALAAAVGSDPAVRLPGTRRLANRARAARDGIAIDAALHAEIQALLGAAR
jgi:(2R)-3-sulfolactate dehydrogenase (NADP+)